MQKKEEVQKLLSNLESLLANGGIASQRYDYLIADYQRQMDAAVAGIAAIKGRISDRLMVPKQGLNTAKSELEGIRAAYNTGNLALPHARKEEDRINKRIDKYRTEIAQLQNVINAKSSTHVLLDDGLTKKQGWPVWARLVTVIVSVLIVVPTVGLIVLSAIYANAPKSNDPPIGTEGLPPAVQQRTETEDWVAVTQRVERSVVFIATYNNGKNTGSGSGTIIDTQGYILTNNHVIYNDDTYEVADEIYVYIYTGQEIKPGSPRYRANLVRRDETKDIAILKIVAGFDLPAVNLGDSDTINSGEEVRAIGYPWDYQDKKTGSIGHPSVTDGIISELPRAYTIPNIKLYECERIKHTAPSNFGNSGGALINKAGELIGIPHTKSAPERQNENFAIAINEAKSMIREAMGR